MNYPEIRFKHPWLLIDTIYPDIRAAYEKPNDELYKLNYRFIQRTLNRYEKAWRPYEGKLIRGVCELFELDFRQNTIDVYAAPFYRAFSDPMFIATKYTSDRAVEVITHEILHRLLSDNLQTTFDRHYAREWKKAIGVHDFNVAVHIPVHAALQALFDDVLGEPERTVRDKKMCQRWPDYKAAWKYVDEVGYKVVIERVKNAYKEMHEHDRISAARKK